MEVISGEVTNVRHSVSLSGGDDRNITTTHITVFRVNGCQVKFKSTTPIMISDGDIVSAAGKVRRGMLVAYAYKNKSTGVRERAGSFLTLFMGIVGVAAIFFFLQTFSEPFLMAIPLMALGIVGYHLYQAYMGLSALRLLDY